MSALRSVLRSLARDACACRTSSRAAAGFGDATATLRCLHSSQPAGALPERRADQASEGRAASSSDHGSSGSSRLPPYDEDLDEGAPMGQAPFIPPPIDKLIRVIMRHGKRDVAQRIVFDASHVLYNATRPKNPRPELKQRHQDFVP
jgi:hypothetical protein